MSRYRDLLAERWDGFLDKYMTVLRFPSVSADPAFADDLRACADWLGDYMCKLGAKVEQIHQYGRPVVYGDFHVSPEKPTVLLYGHYDVQPAADRELWYQEPFEPLIKEGRLYARGATDDKGPIMMGLLAVELLWERGGLPVNLKVVLEGEEESSGTAVFDLVREKSDRLKCDLVLCTDASAFAPDRAAINYSTRGLVYKQIDVYGPKQDLHSGSYGGPVQSPSNALALILAGLFEADGTINIPGVYDKVLPISPEEREAFSKLRFDLERYKKHIGVSELVGEEGFSLQEQNWCRPNLCINGLMSGYTGEGPKTVLPARAMAKLSMRIVPDQDPKEISELMDKRIRELCPPGVRLEIKDLGAAEPFLGLRNGPAVEAAREAGLQVYGQEPDLTREGGTIPILAHFAKYLTKDVLNIGLTGTECNTHGPNENIRLELFEKGIEMNCLLFELLAGKL